MRLAWIDDSLEMLSFWFSVCCLLTVVLFCCQTLNSRHGERLGALQKFSLIQDDLPVIGAF